MASASNPIPYFPVPPAEYSQQYFSEIIRAFSVYSQQVQNPGDARNTTLTLTNLQSMTDQGLEAGALFEVDGVVKITRSFNPHVGGVVGSGSVGTVTVTTT
jgi:hypothetical protein